MLSITEMRDKTKTTCKQIEEQLDSGYFDYSEVNLYGTGYGQDSSDRLGQEDVHQVYETIKNAPLREFLAKSGTSGIAGD